jgi:hypothetical protein
MSLSTNLQKNVIEVLKPIRVDLVEVAVNGPQGPKGPTGYTGYTGFTGPGNFTGYTGYTGPLGPIGPTGYTGYTGPGNFTGYTGPTGYTGFTGPAASLTTSTGTLGADVTMTTAGTAYDGPTTSALATGTWLIISHVTIDTAATNSSQNLTAKLWNGTTVIASCEMSTPSVSAPNDVGYSTITLAGIATTNNDTWRITCFTTKANSVILRNPANSSPGANNASQIIAVKIG